MGRADPERTADTSEFNWWVKNILFLRTYSPDEILSMLDDSMSQNSRSHIVSAFKNIFISNTILGSEIGMGKCEYEIKGGKRYWNGVVRTNWENPDPSVILYGLYKFAEACGGYYQFTLSRLLDFDVESDGVSPAQIFGLDRKEMEKLLSYAFGIPLNLCTSVEQTRERIRNKMKEFSFPIWTIKSILPSMELKTGRAILEELIDSYCGIANSNNMGKSKTDSDIALAIGDLSAKNPDAKEDLRILLTKDNCTAGMRAYVQEFDGSELVTLAEEIGDNGQYINVLRSKFDADAANWVWNVETAQQKIREVILEYRIIAESNKVIPKNVSFSSTIREWCDKCGLIRISYAAAKNYLGDVAPFLELLHTIKKAGTILDSQKQKFLDLLVAHADEFNAFYSNQVELFKKVCAYYLDGFSEEEVRALYQTIPAGTFTNDKTEYMNLIDSKAKDYRNSLGNERLKKLWKDKTGSTSPRQWSKEHLMPILSLVPDREVQTARAAFGAVNKNHPDASSIEKAVTYLENASFYSLMNDQDALDRIFRESIIKSFAVMLTDIDEVKSFLNSRISSEPYEWFGLPEVDKKLEQMAEDKYIREGCTRALEKIDGMDVGDVKRYLKELIKDNMIVGMEIIKEN